MIKALRSAALRQFADRSAPPCRAAGRPQVDRPHLLVEVGLEAENRRKVQVVGNVGREAPLPRAHPPSGDGIGHQHHVATAIGIEIARGTAPPAAAAGRLKKLVSSASPPLR
jgi:hypothetical protein